MFDELSKINRTVENVEIKNLINKILTREIEPKNQRLFITKLYHDDIIAISILLKFNILTDLSLPRANIGDSGAFIIASVLEQNTTLLSLDVSYNFITRDGINALINALENNFTLQSMCVYRVADDQQNKINQLINRNHEYTNQRKQIKILLLLCRKFGNDSLFFNEHLPLDIFKIIYKSF